MRQRSTISGPFARISDESTRLRRRPTSPGLGIVSNMGSTCIAVPPEVVAAFDALDAAVATTGELNLDKYAPGVRLHALERLETARRQQKVPNHDLIAGLAERIRPTSAARSTR